MPKANRTCYCCGRNYYYCPSCSGDRRDPRIYTMWDSEKCKDIFETLVSESTKKITTLECKEKLIELGVNKNTKLKDSVRNHVDRVMSCKEIEEKDTAVKSVAVTEETNSESDNKIESSVETENIKKVNKARTRKSSVKTKENSEVD